MSGSSALLKAIQNLGNKHPHVRCAAVASIASALSEHKENEVNEEVRLAVRCLAEHVGDADEATAVKAAGCLAMTGLPAVVAFPELAKAVLDKRQPVGAAAANALLKLLKLNDQTRKKAVQVLPVLAEGLMEMHPEVLSQAAAIIRAMEKDAEPTIELLVEQHLLPEPQGTMEKLREKVTGQYHKHRQRCFDLLGKIGPVAAPALPALKELMKSPDPWLQQQAKSCIIRIRRTA